MERFESFIGVNLWTALFTLGNFLLLLFVARRFLLKPVMALIRSRQQEIDQLYSDADAARSSAQDMEAVCRKKLTAATETGERIVKEAVARGQAQEEAILRQAREKAAAITEKAALSAAAEKVQAMREAKSEISEIAILLAGKVVGRALRKGDHDRLIDDFIENLGDDV